MVSNKVVNICNSRPIENSTKEVYGCNYPFTDNFDNASKKLKSFLTLNHTVLGSFSYFLSQLLFSSIIHRVILFPAEHGD